MIPRKLLRTDAGRAAVAQAWLDGYTQVRIARKCFGYRTGFAVCEQTDFFIRTYAPEYRDHVRTANHLRTAIARYVEARNAVDARAAL